VPGDGFSIQVAALRQRGEAESVARGLTTKGYPAFVMNPDAGAPAVFRVRVGKFKDRREAESVAARLQKEEQFKPWIVR
jgi:cell division septation protein DedD